MSADQKKNQLHFTILKLNSFDKPAEIDTEELDNEKEITKKQNDSKSFF